MELLHNGVARFRARRVSARRPARWVARADKALGT